MNATFFQRHLGALQLLTSNNRRLKILVRVSRHYLFVCLDIP